MDTLLQQYGGSFNSFNLLVWIAFFYLLPRVIRAYREEHEVSQQVPKPRASRRKRRVHRHPACPDLKIAV